MEIEELRRMRLREAASELGGSAKLALKIERSDSQVSQIIGKKPTRNISGEPAREFEKKLGKPPFWLERPPEDAEPDIVMRRRAREPEAAYDPTDKELRIVLEQWPDLSPEKRKQLAAEALLGNIPPPPASPEDMPASSANPENPDQSRRGGIFHFLGNKRPKR